MQQVGTNGKYAPNEIGLHLQTCLAMVSMAPWQDRSGEPSKMPSTNRERTIGGSARHIFCTRCQHQCRRTLRMVWVVVSALARIFS